MKSVHVVAMPNSITSVLTGACDMLGAAGALWTDLVDGRSGTALFELSLVSCDTRPVQGANGVMLVPQLRFADHLPADIIFVPPLWLREDDDAYRNHGDLFAWLRRAHAAGTTITSACTGSLLLAAAGLLDGRDATTHWAFAATMRRNHPRVRVLERHTLVESSHGGGRVITAGAHASWHGLVLHLVRMHGGLEAAAQLARVFLLRTAESQHAQSSGVLRRLHGDAAVSAAEDWLHENFAQDTALERVVAHARIGRRSFTRRFREATGMTPIAYLQAVRVEHAKTALLVPDRRVDEVANAVGYEDPGYFSRIFKRATGMTPAAYRRQFAFSLPAVD